jgi:hypothetical protein
MLAHPQHSENVDPSFEHEPSVPADEVRGHFREWSENHANEDCANAT